MKDISYAPWSVTEVKNLRTRQADSNHHPYTCGLCGEPLHPTYDGWHCLTPACTYTQRWAHKDDTEGNSVLK